MAGDARPLALRAPRRCQGAWQPARGPAPGPGQPRREWRCHQAAASMEATSAVVAAGSPMVVIFKGPSDRPVLALTIDDFPSSGTDQPGTGSMALIDLLGELAIPATFFCIGERVQKHPSMAARAVAAGHEFGNHMERDQWSITLGQEDFLQQLEATALAIKNDLAAAGQTAPLRWFRPSGGWFHQPMVEWARSRGYRTVLGSIWPLDGLGPAPPEPAQRWIVERFAHPGGIVVLHDTTKDNPATRRTLQAVVPELKQRGYSFVTLSTLLGLG